LFFLFFFFLKIILIHLRETKIVREHEQGGEGEAGSWLSREPGAGLMLGLRDHDLSGRQTLN